MGGRVGWEGGGGGEEGDVRDVRGEVRHGAVDLVGCGAAEEEGLRPVNGRRCGREDLEDNTAVS